MVIARITMAVQQPIIVMVDKHAGRVRRITLMEVFLIHMMMKRRHASHTLRRRHLHLHPLRIPTTTAGGVFGQSRQIKTKLTMVIRIRLWLWLRGRRSMLLDRLPRHPQIRIMSQLLKCRHRRRQRR